MANDKSKLSFKKKLEGAKTPTAAMELCLNQLPGSEEEALSLVKVLELCHSLSDFDSVAEVLHANDCGKVFHYRRYWLPLLLRQDELQGGK